MQRFIDMNIQNAIKFILSQMINPLLTYLVFGANEHLSIALFQRPGILIIIEQTVYLAYNISQLTL